MAPAATAKRVRSRPRTSTRSMVGSPTRFQASSAPSESPSRNRLVARIRAACASPPSRASARRASAAAAFQSLLTACRPASSRQGAASRGHRAAARVRSARASSSEPSFASRTACSTRPAQTRPGDVVSATRSAAGEETSPALPELSGATSMVQNPARLHARMKAASSRILKGARAGSCSTTRPSCHPTITT